MKDSHDLVVTRQYRVEATKWLESLKRRENASIIFFPKTDRLIRFQQFLQDRTFLKSVLGKEARFLFQILDFDTHNVEDRYEMLDRIAEQMNFSRLTPGKMNFRQWVTYLRTHHVTLVLVMPQAEKYLSEVGSNILSYLSNIVDTYGPNIVALCFFEADITHSSYTKHLPGSTRLLQNIHYYPLYQADDTRSFIRYLSAKWGSRLTGAQENEITGACGGHFWLVKEAVRQMTAGHPNPLGQEGMLFRLRTIYDVLSPSERSALSKVAAGKKNFDAQESESLRYFQKMNFVDGHGHCAVELFQDFIDNSLGVHTEFAVVKNKIFLNGVPVDLLFSRQEQRVFRLMLGRAGSVLSREAISEAIWPVHTQQNYSDWAIDQVIARLRKRLKDLSLSPKLLLAVRGKGYLLNLQHP